MFVEQEPKELDTVKIQLSMPEETIIGVFLRFHDRRAIIDVGSRLLYIDYLATILVLIKH